MSRDDEDSDFFTPTGEGDVDLILLEELYCSNEFRIWFCGCVFGKAVHPEKLISLQRSSWDTYGEADLVFVFDDASGKRRACLIEDKINAILQFEQPERYRLRGISGLENNRWQEFRTCIVAPGAYLGSVQERFDCAIAYEDLVSWFYSEQSNTRRRFKGRFLELALSKGASAKSLIEEVEFFRLMEEKERMAVANTRSLLEWSQSPSSGIRLAWTTDAFKGSHARRGVTFLYCNTAGSVSVAFKALKKTKAFESEEAREDLRQKLNAIENISLASADGQWEGFLIKDISARDLTYLMEILCWVVNSIDKETLADSPRQFETQK